MSDREEILGKLAQFYCKPEHSHKVLDSNLMLDIADYIIERERKKAVDVAERLRPIKHRNPPKNDFDKGVDAARLLVDDEVNKIISENTPKEVQ